MTRTDPLLRLLRPSRERYHTLAIFCALTLVNAFIWITFAPIAQLSQSYYGVSITGINMLSAVFMVLYGPGLDSVRSGGTDLSSVGVTNLAIANPRTAPYGVAAEAVLGRVGLNPTARSRIVRAANVGQTLQFVRSGAAELGFVALSQVVGEPEYSYWLVPSEYHAPLLQDALLLQAGEENPVARDYLAFLRSDEAKRVFESFGYETGLRSDP